MEDATTVATTTKGLPGVVATFLPLVVVKEAVLRST
jgi:hypothetical protein